MNPLTLEVKLLISASVLAVVSALGYTAYDHIYDRGYAAAEAAFEKKQLKQVAEITEVVRELSTATEKYNSDLRSDMLKLRNTLSGKTLVEYRNGKCVLTQEFRDARAKAIDRANQR